MMMGKVGMAFIHYHSALRPVRQEPELNQVTGMPLAHCILGKFLGYVAITFPPAFRCSHFHRQVPSRPRRHESTQQRKVELWAINVW